MTGGFSQEILLAKSDLNDSDQKFTYKLKFKLDDTFKGISKAPITVSIYFSKPDEGGRSGIELAIFNVNINPWWHKYWFDLFIYDRKLPENI